MTRPAPERGYRAEFPHGLMFHRFGDTQSVRQRQGTLTAEEFERILVFVGLKNIRTPGEWIRSVEAGTLGNRDFCITFDDGLRCQLEHALPVLERHGLKAFWFVYSCVFEGVFVKSEIYSSVGDQIGGMETLIAALLKRCPQSLLSLFETEAFREYSEQMSRVAPFYSANDRKFRFLRNRAESRAEFEDLMDALLVDYGFPLDRVAQALWLRDSDLKSLVESGHCLGLHSYDHPYAMAELSYEHQLAQYQRNHRHLSTLCPSGVVCMSHPLNSYNEQTLDVLRRLGIQCGFRANTAPPPGGRINPSPLELAREDSANLLRMANQTTQSKPKNTHTPHRSQKG